MLKIDYQKKLTIMDFTGIYENENFYKHDDLNWIDCRNIEGVYGYCSQEAKGKIKACIKDYGPFGIHFIDSGNFHYISELWINKIKQDFVLVVFDHHSDMVKPLFSDILSCGSWIMDSLKYCQHLKKVILIGIDSSQVKLIDREYLDKIYYLVDDDLENRDVWNDIDRLLRKYPTYVSIDKDVLSKQVIHTDWDQGKMRGIELKMILYYLFVNSQIIGIDICGECANEINHLKEIKTDDHLNQSILSFLKKEMKR